LLLPALRRHRPNPSYLADASASGNDAFLFTREALVPQDADQIQDIYDASVGGGLASQNQVLTPICEGEACKEGAREAPTSSSPGTATFAGPGNQKPVHKNAKKKKRRHQAKKHHHKRQAKHARAHR
jgi:hypothetical protein